MHVNKYSLTIIKIDWYKKINKIYNVIKKYKLVNILNNKILIIIDEDLIMLKRQKIIKWLTIFSFNKDIKDMIHKKTRS